MKDYVPELTKQLLAKCKKQGCNEVEAATHLAAALLALTPAITANGGKRALRRLKLIYSKFCTGHTLLDHYIFYKPTR